MILPEETQATLSDGSFRFTDADVRANPMLLAQAVEFLTNYHDDWKPLRDARLMAVATGTLTVPVARMVLNCMRTQALVRWHPGGAIPIPSHQHEPEHVVKHQASSSDVGRVIEAAKRFYDRNTEDPPSAWVPGDPHWMNQARRNHGSVFTKFTPKMRFVVSEHPPAERRVWHLVNLDACWAEWRDGTLVYYHIALWCKSRHDHLMFTPEGRRPNSSNIPYQFANLPDERKICATCPRIKEESSDR
jgi:hypothetical protein